MNSSWITWLDTLKEDGIDLLKPQLKNLIETTKSDSESFIKEQGNKIELYLNQLAACQITKEQFKINLQEIHDLMDMKDLEMVVEAKARAQKFASEISDLILNRLLSLIP